MIAILMSTYNGEKYLREQIESLFVQTEKGWKLYVRDDGSKDSTMEILSEYEQRYPNKVCVVRDIPQNLGAGESFMHLLGVTDAEYYMFSDQDDVWMPDKIERTYSKLLSLEKQYGSNIGIGVFTDLTLVDAELNVGEEKSKLRGLAGNLPYVYPPKYYKKDKLSLLSEVNVINNFNNIKKDIDKISYAAFLLELAEQVYRQQPNNNIYTLLIDGLIKINENYDSLVITNIIELKFLDFLGVLPVLDGCAVCGTQNNIVTLSSDLGGYLCGNCRTNEPIINKKSIKLIRMYYYVDISKIEKLEVSMESKKEINTFLDNYYAR